jgi:hypothetical protein
VARDVAFLALGAAGVLAGYFVYKMARKTKRRTRVVRAVLCNLASLSATKRLHNVIWPPLADRRVASPLPVEQIPRKAAGAHSRHPHDH